MSSFDPAELLREGVILKRLPDEDGYIVDPAELPSTFAKRLKDSGLDVIGPLRVVGEIERSPGGVFGRYVIRFEQA